MSLFTSIKRSQAESDASVKIYNQILAHEKTFPEVQKIHEANLPEIEKLDDQLARARKNGRWTQALYDELTTQKRKLESALVNYKVVQADLRLELQSLTRPFINSEIERWKEEVLRVKSQKIHHELPKLKEPAGEFSIGGPRKLFTNMKAIVFFRQRSQELLNILRDMLCQSIPQISEFIANAEKELLAIDLTPSVTEVSESDFKKEFMDSRAEPGRTSEGFLTNTGGVEVGLNPQLKKDSGDVMFDKFDQIKKAFRPKL
jgi:hypothetical protein